MRDEIDARGYERILRPFSMRATRFVVAPLQAAAIILLLWIANSAGVGESNAGPTTFNRSELASRGQELTTPAHERKRSPYFSVKTASFGDGSVFDLTEKKGNVVVMFFMAGWCVTCIPEARALAELHD